MKYLQKDDKIEKYDILKEEFTITVIYKILNKMFDLIDEYKPKMKLIIALGCILLAFIIAVILVTANVKYIFFERNVQDKAPDYRLGEWYYNSLTYKEQLLYNEVEEAAEKIDDKTDNLPYLYTEDEFVKVVKSVVYDNPELFYLMSDETELFTTSRKTHVKLNYYDDKSDIKAMRKELNNKLAEIASALDIESEDADNFDIETAIHDYIVLNCEIDLGNEYNYINDTAYGALINGKAYSGGYSAAFKLLMNRYGMVCYVIEGEVNDQRHLWNMVYINGSYFHVDVTWNDSDIEYVENLLFHAYFNVSNTIISEDHYIPDLSLIPAAHTESNYYNMKNLYIIDLEDMKSRINRIILDALENEPPKMFFELYTNFGADVYEGEEFRKIIIDSLRQINQSDTGISLDESFRIYKASNSKNILTIQLYNLEN